MKPQDLIRAAAKIIETQGWCSGTNNQGHVVHVRDQSGIPLPLYRGDNTGQDKAKVNPGARSFSIYGALCKAIHDARGAVASPGAMWQVLQQIAITEGAPRTGGTNYVHPVIGINEREGQTKDGVLAFLERCAVEFEAPFDANAVTFPAAGEPDPADLGLAIVHPSVMEALREYPTENTSDLVAMALEDDLSDMFEVEIPPPNPAPPGPAPAPIKAPVASPKADPKVEETKSRLPPIGWGE